MTTEIINFTCLVTFGILLFASLIALLTVYPESSFEKKQLIVTMLLICLVGFQNAYYEFKRSRK